MGGKRAGEEEEKKGGGKPTWNPYVRVRDPWVKGLEDSARGRGARGLEVPIGVLG